MPTSPRRLSSPQVRAVLDVLADGEWHSTWEISRRARLCDAATVIREIRGRGWDVPREIKGGHHYWRLSTDDLQRLIDLQRAAAEAVAAIQQQQRQEQAP